MGASCRSFIPRVAKTPAARQRIARPLGTTFGRDRAMSSRASRARGLEHTRTFRGMKLSPLSGASKQSKEMCRTTH